MRRGWLIGGVAAVALAGGAVAVDLTIGDVASVFTGGAAKMYCSDIFVAGRDPDLAWKQDFQRLTPPGKYLGLARATVDTADKSVSASLWGYKKRTAIFREGIGCTTADGISVAELRAQGQGVATALPPHDPTTQWPEGDATLVDQLPAGVDGALLEAAMDQAFAEPDPLKPRNTRGLVVVYQGRIIAERYGDGFDKETTHLSNSVAKSVTATLIGVLVHQGRLKLADPAPITEWRRPGDPRGAITLDHLMRMSSGLAFEEDYSGIKSDITMQYVGGDLAGYAAAQPLEAPPGTRWSYATGTSNILGRIVRETAGRDLPTGFAFPRKALFEPLGMRTAVIEPDAKGNFVGGSNVQASVRDYARLGLLYLRDGIWNGRRILPEGWVDYVRTPVVDSVGPHEYGAQFWLSWDGRESPKPDNADGFSMSGHQGQSVYMLPSRDLVIVRVGLSEGEGWEGRAFIAGVLKALPSPSGAK